MKYLVTGAGGLLGETFRYILAEHSLATLSRRELDVEQPRNISDAIAAAAPDIVINCAAHTDVEGAEGDPDRDHKANAILPAIMAEACRAQGALLIHFSSTGCYGDWKTEAYTERDRLIPTTAHHRAKVAGEDAISQSGCDHLILRTGWLYGGGPTQSKNFVWKRLVEARSKSDMTSDASQRGCPTFVMDVAENALAIAEGGARGIFNLVAHGAASRYEYVARIVEYSGLPCTVSPGPAFRRFAAVSPNETAVNEKLQSLGLDLMRDWQDPLRHYVMELMSSPEWFATNG